MNIIKKFILLIIKRLTLASKILFTFNKIESRNIQGNNIILIIPKNSSINNSIKLILDEKKLLLASNLYFKEPQKQVARQLIIKPCNQSTNKPVKYTTPNQIISRPINKQQKIQQNATVIIENTTKNIK